MNRIYRYRIYPSKSQSRLIVKTFGCVRFVYNKMLQDRKAVWEKHKGDAQALSGYKYPLPASYKDSCPWLREVDSLALANAYLNLQSAYKNFFKKGGSAFPKFKSKRGGRRSYTTNNQKGSVRIEEDKNLRLPKIGKVKIKLHRPLPEGAKIKAATVSMTEPGIYHASLLVETAGCDNTKPAESREGKSIVLCGPSGWVYKDSRGGGEKTPENCAKVKRRLQEEKKKLKRKKAGGQNFKKQLKKIACLKYKATNQRKDLLHKLSRRIANAWEQVAVKDAGSDKSQGTWFKELRKLLTYKLAEQGKKLTVVRREPSRERESRLPGVA